jgi:hypothetical protein
MEQRASTNCICCWADQAPGNAPLSAQVFQQITEAAASQHSAAHMWVTHLRHCFPALTHCLAIKLSPILCSHQAAFHIARVPCEDVEPHPARARSCGMDQAASNAPLLILVKQTRIDSLALRLQGAGGTFW